MAETLTSASETVAPGGAGYDAFVSYSHAADGQLAPALQTGLQALGKPWYRRRALRVFRDKTSLSATPELWPTIERALAGSRYFVVLASPEAAASRWVDQEVGWWREHRSPSTVLIGLTGGELAWDEGRQAFDPARTTALPPAAFGWFAREPLWVDLRWAREVRHVSLRDPRFREGVADLAAPIRQLPKDELIGEDIRQHRRALRLARSAVTSLVLLTVLAVVAASVAVVQRNDAREQTRLATARQVAATATAGIPQRLDLSLLLAVQAYRQRRTPQTEAALFQAATASPHLVRFADNGTPVTALTPLRDGTRAATGGEDGTVRVWDLTGGRHPVPIADFDQQVTAVGADASGRHLLVGGAGGLVAVVDTTTRDVTVLQPKGRKVTGVALDPVGVRAAVLDDAYRVTVFDLSRQRAEASATSDETPDVVAFRAGGTQLMLGTGLGSTSRWSVSPLRRRSKWTGMETPANDFTPGYSNDGRWFGYYKFGVVVKNTGVAAPRWRNYPMSSRAYASVIAIAPDASRVAVASGGTISVVQADLPYEQYGDAFQEGGMVGDPLPGVGAPIDALAFVGGRERLVSASQRLLVLWDLRQQSRIARPAGPDLADHAGATTRPGLTVSPSNGMVASAGDDGSFALWDPKTGRARVRAHGVDAYHGLWFSPDGSRLIAAGNEAISIWRLQRQVVDQVDSWPYPGDLGASLVAPTVNGSTVLVVGDDGSVFALSTSDGMVRKVVAGGERYSIQGAALHSDGSEALLIDNVGGTRLVNLRTGEGRPGPAFGIPVQSAVYSRDGRRLAVTDGGASVLVWDTEALRAVRRIAAERVDRMTFSPRGDRLLTITGEGRMALWDVASGVRLGDLRVLQHAYLDSADVGFQTELAWDPAGSVLWTATLDGTVVRWALDPTEWVRSACAAAGRSFTVDDWRENIGGRVPNDLTCHA
jgi:WD40 repeat protein